MGAKALHMPLRMAAMTVWHALYGQHPPELIKQPYSGKRRRSVSSTMVTRQSMLMSPADLQLWLVRRDRNTQCEIRRMQCDTTRVQDELEG